MSKRFEITVRILLYIHSCCFFCYICLFNVKWSGVVLVIILNSTLGKSAVFNCSSNWYNCNNSNENYNGTAWDNCIFNSLCVNYIPDTSTYKHGFEVPYDGIYRIDIVMQFREGDTIPQCALVGKLTKNNIDQSTQAYLISSYCGANFIFVNEASKGDIFRFLLLQNSGKSIKVSGAASRFNITYLGKK